MTVLKLRAARKRMRAATGRCERRKPFGELPGEAEIVSRLQAMRLQGLTFDRIAETLNEEGVRTRFAGRKWFGSTAAKILRRVSPK